MKICYAFRRGTYYPYHGPDLPPKEERAGWLRAVHDLGFDGIELPHDCVESEQAAGELRRELEEAGVPCVAIRGGGGVATQPHHAATSRKRWLDTLQIAAWLGADVVNGNLITPPREPEAKGTHWGDPVSQGGSRHAGLDDFERTAQFMVEMADRAAELGLVIAIEVHQQSINDSTWAALHLMQLINRPNVGLNPDLGNIYWLYHVPQESCESAIVALAPYTKYWHCKNLYRVYIPENEHSIFLQVALPDGEIDYRYAITALQCAGYAGYIAVEGVRLGDQLYSDGRSIEYVRSILRSLE